MVDISGRGFWEEVNARLGIPQVLAHIFHFFFEHACRPLYKGSSRANYQGKAI